MKGVSEFVVVLIILIVAISSILVVWLFYNSMFGSVTTQGETSSLGEALSSCMKIDSASGNKVYLKNCGSGSISNYTLRVYIDEAPINFSMNLASIGNGGIGTIELYNIQNLSSGNHKLKIANPSGDVERFVKVILTSTAPFDNVLWLRFNESSGATTYDSSPNHNDGTLQNIYPLDVLPSNPSLEDPWYLVNNTDANHRIERADKWDTSYDYNSSSKMLALNETSIVKNGNSSLHFTLVTDASFLGSISINQIDPWGNCPDKFPINESQYLEGGNFRYILKGDSSYCDQSMYFYNDSGTMCRRWSNTSYILDNVDGGGGWLIKSYVWLPSSGDTNPPDQGGYIPYIPKGAKYACFQQFLSWQDKNANQEAVFDKFFVYQWPSMPTNQQRIDRASSGWVPGKYGSALNFDGFNDYVSLGDRNSLDVDSTNNFSITAWFKTNQSSDSDGSIVSKGTGCYGTGYRFNVWGSLYFEMENGTTSVGKVTSTMNPNDNNWHYGAVVVDRTNKNLTLYVDGNYNNYSSYSTNYNLDNSYEFLIGANRGACGSYHNYFNGIIDEVKIYNTTLTQQEIQTVMQGGEILRGGTPSLALGELT